MLQAYKVQIRDLLGFYQQCLFLALNLAQLLQTFWKEEQLINKAAWNWSCKIWNRGVFLTNTYPSSVQTKFLALFLTDNVKSYIDKHPVDWVFHLKTFEENVGLEQSDGLRNILGMWQFQRLSFKIQTLFGLSSWPLIPCRLIQKGNSQKHTTKFCRFLI